MKYLPKFHKGFTLIELLVVIAIIGILAALSIVSYTTSQRQARDAQRKSDLKQYSTALEAFANGSGGLFPSYPAGTALAESGNALCDDLGLTKCPAEPSGTTDYQYISDGAGAGAISAIKYILSAQLESSSNFYLVCSNGKSGAYASEPGTADCPI
ncbi:MAG TPA: type II secretion system protein [Patescibacteria group bacterium]|nr:type II secretion system protein [Patescibacteria group bacterium]